jgi:dUTP pyrophosphatase
MRFRGRVAAVGSSILRGMANPIIQLLRCGPVSVPIPRYATDHAAGLDLHAAIETATTLRPGMRKLIPTGLRAAIPVGFEGQVRPRSGLALRHGITVLNSPGTIDADYRGEIGIVLINHGQETVTLNPLERIAQLVIAPATRAQLELVERLDVTPRGEGGYGSTGVAAEATEAILERQSG